MNTTQMCFNALRKGGAPLIAALRSSRDLWRTPGHRKQRAHRRAVICAAAALCAIYAPLALTTSSASAYKEINEHCILRVTAPEPQGNGTFKYGGAVDCTAYGDVWSYLDVCAEVQNTSNGKWYEISGSCVYDYEAQWEDDNRLSEYHTGDCGVNYRTIDYGSVWHGTKASGPTTGWGEAKEVSSSVNNTC